MGKKLKLRKRKNCEINKMEKIFRVFLNMFLLVYIQTSKYEFKLDSSEEGKIYAKVHIQLCDIVAHLVLMKRENSTAVTY